LALVAVGFLIYRKSSYVLGSIKPAIAAGFLLLIYQKSLASSFHPSMGVSNNLLFSTFILLIPPLLSL